MVMNLWKKEITDFCFVVLSLKVIQNFEKKRDFYLIDANIKNFFNIGIYSFTNITHMPPFAQSLSFIPCNPVYTMQTSNCQLHNDYSAAFNSLYKHFGPNLLKADTIKQTSNKELTDGLN